jgi:hypothetical protein
MLFIGLALGAVVAMGATAVAAEAKLLGDAQRDTGGYF